MRLLLNYQLPIVARYAEALSESKKALLTDRSFQTCSELMTTGTRTAVRHLYSCT